jgi:hypothetical protein
MRGFPPRWSIHESSQSFKASDRRQAGFRGFWQVIAPPAAKNPWKPQQVNRIPKTALGKVNLWGERFTGSRLWGWRFLRQSPPQQGQGMAIGPRPDPRGSQTPASTRAGRTYPYRWQLRESGRGRGLDGKPNFFGVYLKPSQIIETAGPDYTPG